jgi:hypothetical protein
LLDIADVEVVAGDEVRGEVAVEGDAVFRLDGLWGARTRPPSLTRAFTQPAGID